MNFGLGVEQIKIFRIGALQGADDGLGFVELLALYQTVGQQQLQLAAIRIGSHKDTCTLQGSRRINLDTVFQHALRGGFGMRVQLQGFPCFALGPAHVPGTPGGIRQGQTGYGQGAHGLLQGLVQHFQRQTAIHHLADHAHGLDHGLLFILGARDTQPQGIGQAFGLTAGGFQGQSRCFSFGIIRGQQGPFFSGTQRTTQITVGHGVLKGVLSQARIAGVTRQRQESLAGNVVFTTRSSHFGNQNAIQNVRSQADQRQLPAAQTNLVSRRLRLEYGK